MKKTLDTVFTIGLIVVLIAMAALSLMFVISSANDGVASVFGYSPIVIEDTKSMEPFFGSDDLVIIRKQDTSNLKKGDIISFWGYTNGQRNIITHEIYDVMELKDGTYSYQTKGRNNSHVDQDPNNEYRQADILQQDIIGVYVFHIPILGAVVSFVRSPIGIMICLVIPLAIIFLLQLVRVIRMAFAYNRELQAEKNAQMSEDEKQRVIEEYLRQQQIAQETQEPQDNSNSVE